MQPIIRRGLSVFGACVFDSIMDEIVLQASLPCHQVMEFRRRSTKAKGDKFEQFCQLWLLAQGYECFLLKDIPIELGKELGLNLTRDVGIDLIFRMPGHVHFHAVQCKFRAEKKARVTWKSISTFLALCQRTGPWEKHLIMTNTSGCSWQGKRSSLGSKNISKHIQATLASNGTFWHPAGS